VSRALVENITNITFHFFLYYYFVGHYTDLVCEFHEKSSPKGEEKSNKEIADIVRVVKHFILFL
jgi:hypothetical protein